jgi:predicted permease
VRDACVEIDRRTMDVNQRATLARELWRDLRFAVRAVRRRPGFATLAAGTLALGIGATTAVFTLVNGVLLKPLPYPDSDALVSLKHTSSTTVGPPVAMTLSLLVTYSKENKSFQDIGVWSRGAENVTDGVIPEEVTTLNVSAGTLRALGVQPVVGRWFSDEDHAPGSEETVILTHGYWERRFGRDPAIIGRQLSIDSRPRTVVGVMPASFRFLDETAELILPVRIDPALLTLGNFHFEGLARLADGVTPEQASGDVVRMLPIWMEAWPSFPGVERSAFSTITPLVRPLKEELVGGVDTMLWVVMGTIGIVLLLACANVASLVLVRAQSRHQELAVRAALGAGRGRLALQLLLESLVLGLLGGAAGLVLAWGGLRVSTSVGAASIPRLHEVGLEPRVLLFTLGISLLSALLVGAMPVAKFADTRLALTLRSGGRGSSAGQERHRARGVLVVVQVAIALVLLVGSGLMVRTILALRSVPPGFVDPHEVQLVRVTLSEMQVGDPERVLRMQHDMLDRIAAIPGVTAAAFTGNVPMAGERNRGSIVREEAPDDPTAQRTLRWFRYVAPGYFQTIGTRLVSGRDFTWDDVEHRFPVTVVSENLARELWGDPRAAVGKRIREGAASPWREVVGVVGDVYDDGVHRPAPLIAYWPSFMETFLGQPVNVRRAVTFAVRSRQAGTASLLTQIRDAIASVQTDVPITRVRTLGDVYRGSMAVTSFVVVMMATSAGMALALGVIGIYGVIAYAVTQRRREIGIRAALGASHRELEAMFVRDGVRLALLGVASGLAAAVALTQPMASLLFGTKPIDPVTYALVSLGLMGVAAVASYVPARRAALVDPVETLRGE